jgi:hypothetical protein
MRQWGSAFVVLIVVVTIAAFTVGSIVTVVNAAVSLQHSVVEIDDLTFAESLGECDELDPYPCL